MYLYIYIYMGFPVVDGVAINGGTPKWMVFNGKSQTQIRMRMGGSPEF